MAAYLDSLGISINQTSLDIILHCVVAHQCHVSYPLVDACVCSLLHLDLRDEKSGRQVLREPLHTHIDFC